MKVLNEFMLWGLCDIQLALYLENNFYWLLIPGKRYDSFFEGAIIFTLGQLDILAENAFYPFKKEV